MRIKSFQPWKHAFLWSDDRSANDVFGGSDAADGIDEAIDFFVSSVASATNTNHTRLKMTKPIHNINSIKVPIRSKNPSLTSPRATSGPVAKVAPSARPTVGVADPTYVAPGGGVVFYDAYYVLSGNGGTSFEAPVKISATRSDPDASSTNSLTGQFLGDYNGADVGSNGTFWFTP